MYGHVALSQVSTNAGPKVLLKDLKHTVGASQYVHNQQTRTNGNEGSCDRMNKTRQNQTSYFIYALLVVLSTGVQLTT